MRTKLNGDVEQIYDTNGNLLARYTYDTWGKTVSIVDANGNAITDANHIANVNPIRYRGYYWDEESGLYYLQSRYYNPEIGRFINADSYASTGQGLLSNNMFAYSLNNPVNRFDPSGHYSRDKANEYAEEWHNKKNKKYYYYTSGDCANFVSQCLIAGGLDMTGDWYCQRSEKNFCEILTNPVAWFVSKYRYNWSSGEAWRLADEQYRYFSNPDNGYINGDVITLTSTQDIAAVASSGGIQTGDLLYFSTDGLTVHHATIITTVTDNMIYFAGHTSPQYDCSLADKMGSETIFIVRICDDA